MKIDALLTCAVINMGISAVFFSLYAILRRQPCNATVYFGRRLEILREKRYHGICSEPLVPTSSWIVKAWETSENELLNIGGLDAVVFCRVLVFSLQIFSIAAVVCVLFVLPVNYNGKESMQIWISSRSMELFTIAHVPEGSQWLWVHCLALYIITCPACLLLYFNYKSITSMRLNHIIGSPPNPSHFSILVRSIPWSPQQSYSESVTKFFTKYHASGYLSHQMVYKCGTVEKIMSDAEKVWKSCSERKWNPTLMHCGLCGSKRHSFRMLSEQLDSVVSPATDSSDTTVASGDKECAAAFVFFKTRFDAVVASKLLQSTHPMLWVTELAPEPHDVYWSHLCIPYHQLWLRRIATVLATVIFVFAFLAPITFVQGLTQVEHLQRISPALRRALKSNLMNQLLTGYLPSVILIFFLWTVPPAMMISSAAEGCVSRSGRKMSACQKVLYFTIWNVYFVNVLSGSVINSVVEDGPKEIFSKIAKAVPMQASFFMALSLTSGWASLSWEIMQFFPLVCNWFRRFILKYDENASCRHVAFPYQTEFPKVLLFGLIGFTCSIMAPLILPFILVYYFLSYLVYKNQFINVYSTKYESGGRYWPIAYNTTIFSLVLTQVTAIGFFGLRQCPYEASFTIPLVIGTLLFYMYCRRRFKPIFNCNTAIEVLVEMDMRDEQSGRLRKIYEELHAAYCQFTCQDSCSSELSFVAHEDEDESIYSSESSNRGRKPDEDDAWSTCGDVGVERDLISM